MGSILKGGRKSVNGVGFWIIVITAVIIYLKALTAKAQVDISASIEQQYRPFGEKLEKPQRPRVFTSSDELKNYLEALARYYATVSRNRFGKRSTIDEDKEIFDSDIDKILGMDSLLTSKREKEYFQYNEQPKPQQKYPFSTIFQHGRQIPLIQQSQQQSSIDV